MNNSWDDFLAKPRGDKQIRLHVSRNTLIAFVLSILLHALVVLLVVPKIDLNPSPATTTIEVSFSPRPTVPAPTPEPETVLPEEAPSSKPTVITKKPSSKPSKSSPRDSSIPKVLVTPAPSAQQTPVSPRPQSQNSSEAPKDMMAMVNQKRAQRDAQEVDAARQNAMAAATERGPSEDEKRDAKIKRNFQNGTNGIFEITGPANLTAFSPNATFSFLGWTSSLSNAHREFFEVEASSGKDVRLIMIRRMIDLIRTHYQGDFDWQSQRLGRTIVKSARVEDSAELEDFLMQEFFGPHYKTQ